MAEVVEEFTRRVQTGEHVDLEDYARKYPESAPFLRLVLKTLSDMALLSRSGVTRRLSVPPTSGFVPPSTFGDFAIRREVGRGGMGIVFEAEQISLSRRVALKILPAAIALEARSLRRFQLEAQAAACLHHENIVPVYATGDHDDIPFYAMQFIEGANLAGVIGALRRIRDDGPSEDFSESLDPASSLAYDLLVDRFAPGRSEASVEPPQEDCRHTHYIRAVVRLAVQAADALEHAHDQGILHRDIKPANLLIDRTGKLWVTDFGLARIVGSSGLTVTGDLAGTLRYMSPEQIRGKRAVVDRRSDIYSLGVTLYELLTLEPVIVAQERWEILVRIDRETPVPLRRLNPSVPLDLATVVNKAIAKDVSARYATAQEFGDDLNSFLQGKPVKARRTNAWELGTRWARRNPVVAGLVAALLAVFLASFVAVTLLWRRADTEANRANQAARAESKLRIRAQAEATERDFDHALDLARRGEVDHGLFWMAEALRQAPSERPELARIARANLTSWTAQTPVLRAILEHHAGLNQAVFGPDGRAVLTGSLDGTARVWDPKTGQPIGPIVTHGYEVRSIAFSPDGQHVLTGGSDGKARAWVAATGQPATPSVVHGDEIRFVAFSPDGRLFLTYGSDRRVCLWDAVTGRRAARPIGEGDLASVQFSPEGRSVLTVGLDGVARVWDAATGLLERSLLRRDDAVVNSKFSPDGLLIATARKDGTARLWEAATGRRVGPNLLHGTSFANLVFSANGKLLLTMGKDGTARLWDTADGHPIGPVLRQGGSIGAAAFSPDGMLLATGSSDHSARIWDTATGQSIGSPMRHRLAIKDVSFSPDGELVLTASEDGTAKLWEIGNRERIANGSTLERGANERDDESPRPRPGVRFEVTAFSPGRDRVLVAGRPEGLARMIETDTGQPVGPPMTDRWSWVNSVAFSPDGRHVATTSHDRGYSEGGSIGSTCRIWDAATGRQSSPLLPHLNYVGAMAFRPDGKALATGAYSGMVHLWDVETGQRPGPPIRAGSIVCQLIYSPDGQLLAIGLAEPLRQVVIWDLAEGVARGEPIRFKKMVTRLAFSPDGNKLAAGSMDTTAGLVDVATGRVIGEPLRHPEAVRGLAFSPDGRLLLTVSMGSPGTGAARLWDAATGRPASPVFTHPNADTTGALAFSPDGSIFATGCDDGSVYLWDVASARQIGPPRLLRGRILALMFRTDGRDLMAVDDRGDVRSWPLLAPAEEPVDRLIRRLQVRSGLELDASREVVVLDADTWRR